MSNKKRKEELYNCLISASIFINNKYKSPLYESCLKGKVNTFNYFASQSFIRDKIRTNSNLYLNAAITSKNKEIIKSILDIEPNNLDTFLLIEACLKELPEVALILIEHGVVGSQKALSIACMKGYIEVASKLLSKGIGNLH